MEVQLEVTPAEVPDEQVAEAVEAVAEATAPEASSAVVEAALEAGEAKGQGDALADRINALEAALKAHAEGDQAEVAALREQIVMLQGAVVLKAAEAEADDAEPEIVEVMGTDTGEADVEPPSLPVNPEPDNVPWYSTWRKRYL